MLYKYYFSKSKINQEIFNKKLNWYYDIKSILYQEKNNYKRETIDNAKIINKDYLKLKTKIFNKKNRSIKIIVKSFNKSRFQKKDNKFKKKYLKLFNYLEKQQIRKFIKHFCVHGSIASDDYIYGWSDFDTFIVLKDSLLSNRISIIKLRNILRKFYKKLLKVSYFHHHGLIVYTESDLKNYLKGYLPKEALEKSFSLFGKETISFKEIYSNTNLSLKSLEDRKKYLKNGILTKLYDHHAYKGKKLEIPLKEGKNQMYQLFCHLGYMLNIPILYFDATKRSIHKKKSFRKFYSEINDEQIIDLIKNTEKVRKNWNKHKFINKKIPTWVLELIGKDYMEKSYEVIKKIIKIIKLKNSYKYHPNR